MTIQRMIQVAAAEVGYRETGNNDTKYNRWLGRIGGYPHNGYGYPWCASFLAWCLDRSGNAGRGPRTASCAVGVAWFRARGRYYSSPKVGDFVYYGAGGSTHVELVVAVSSSVITTVGGNTSGALNGRYYNGDGVYRKSVARSSSRIHGYGRPTYSAGGGAGAESDMVGLKRGDKGERVKFLQELLVGGGFSVGAAGIDGDYGPATARAVVAARKAQGSKAVQTGENITGAAAKQVLQGFVKKTK